MSTNQILRVRLPASKAKIIAAAAEQNGLSPSSYVKTVLFQHIAKKLGETVPEPA